MILCFRQNMYLIIHETDGLHEPATYLLPISASTALLSVHIALAAAS